jgi:predicted DsbA family dithiol-disulfide isomerase
MPIACFKAYFTDGRDPSEYEVLLMSLAAPAHSRSRGVYAVRAVLINDRYLISGDRSPEAFESALRNIAAELAPVA